MACRSAGASCACSSTNATFAATERHGSSAKSWNTSVSGLRLPRGGAPTVATVPAPGCSKPPTMPSIVLLPQHDEVAEIVTDGIDDQFRSISSREAEAFVDHLLDTEAVVDKMVGLKPDKLLRHARHVEHAVAVDIGKADHYLLRLEVRVTHDAVDQRSGLVVDLRAAILDRG